MKKSVSLLNQEFALTKKSVSMLNQEFALTENLKQSPSSKA